MRVFVFVHCACVAAACGDACKKKEETPEPTWPGQVELEAIPASETAVRLEWTAAESEKPVDAYQIARDDERVAEVGGDRSVHRLEQLDPDASYTF